MKKIISLILCCVVFCATPILVGCKSKADVTIYSSMLESSQDLMRTMLVKKFPELKFDIQYVPSGTIAAKIKTEKGNIEADIVMGSDYGYMENLKDNFADVSSFVDTSVFLDELMPKHSKYVPLQKFSIGVVVNEEVLDKIQLPKGYNELISEIYKDNISMPDPVASGTGYGFLKGIVSIMGEENAFKYFDDLQKNIKHFTSSGSGPISALVRGEVGIGICMIFQAVEEINKGVNLKIMNYDEGMPYNMCGSALISGRENKPQMKEVFSFIAKEFNMEDKIKYVPEKIFKNQDETIIKNYPTIVNFDMKGFDSSEQERLLSKWKY